MGGVRFPGHMVRVKTCLRFFQTSYHKWTKEQCGWCRRGDKNVLRDICAAPWRWSARRMWRGTGTDLVILTAEVKSLEAVEVTWTASWRRTFQIISCRLEKVGSWKVMDRIHLKRMADKVERLLDKKSSEYRLVRWADAGPHSGDKS